MPRLWLMKNPVRPHSESKRFRIYFFRMVRNLLGGEREPGLVDALTNAIKETHVSAPKALDFGTGSMLVISELYRRKTIAEYCGVDTYSAKDFSEIVPDESQEYLKIGSLEDLLNLKPFDLAIASDTFHHLEWGEIPKALEYLCKNNKYVIVKDCFEYNYITRQILRLSDWFGNSAYGVNVPKKYLTPRDWENLIESLHLVELKRWTNVKIHNGLFSLILPPRCHFVSLLCSDKSNIQHQENEVENY